MSTQASFSHLFDDQAKSYAEFRPNYKGDLYDQIYKYHGSGKKGLAIDIATGTGQAAAEVAKEFDKVLAIDSNINQLSQAVKDLKVEYKEGNAENIPADDHSADLVTVAQALHWFDIPSFWKEAHRVMRPQGTLAVWGYCMPSVKGNEKASQLILDLRLADDQLGPFWSERRNLVDQEYRDISPDNELFQSVQRQNIIAYSESNIDHFMGYVTSWSAFNTFRKKHPDRVDELLQTFKANLKQACITSDDSHKLTLAWKLFLILSRAE